MIDLFTHFELSINNTIVAAILRIPEEAFNDPERYFCKSESLIDVTNRRKVAHPNKSHGSGGLSEETEDQAISAADLNRDSLHIQWNLRPRDRSDRSSQPHPAPSGTTAQQSENFQRFYRAVVSPTHVRVTAGGRIVPNTRATAPPQFEWNGEKLMFEPRKIFPEIELTGLQPPPSLHSTSFPTGFPQLFPAGFMPSYNYNPQISSALAAMAAQNLGVLSGNDQNSSQNSHPPALNGESGAGPSSPAQPIKISPPSQFDHSKPFMFNGHVVYPVPPGHQPPPHALPFPFGMIGNPNLAHGTLAPPPGGLYLPQLPMPMGHPPSSLMVPPLGQPPALPIPNSTQSPLLENAPLPAPYLPIPGIVSVSELTKLQIQGFRNHLKFLDNQIANNKHQIDENYMENQRSEVTATIAKMEAMLEIQLAHERKQNIGPFFNSTMEPAFDSQPAKNSASGDIRQMGEKSSGVTSSVLAKDGSVVGKTSPPPLDKTVAQSSTVQTTKAEGVPDIDGTSESKPSNRPGPVTKSRLTAAAAMSPPFQPRTQAMVAANSFARPAPNSAANRAPLDSQTYTEGRITDWSHPTYPTTTTGTGHATLSRAHTIHDPSIYTQHDGLPVSFQRFHTIHGQHAAFNSSIVPGTSPVPYLVGTLPQGVQASEARASDLLYPRPLTDEEIRARYLYWGKAPRSAYGSLPKFDGKDFYPPSPVKETIRPASDSPANKSDANRHSTPAPLDFEKLFTVPEQSGYKTPPSRPKHGAPTVTATPTRAPLENINIDFRPPSRRPSGHKYEASTVPGSSADHHDSQDAALKLAMQAAMDQKANVTQADDFSNLFLEPGVPGYKSPTPPRPAASQFGLNSSKEDAMHATPKEDSAFQLVMQPAGDKKTNVTQDDDFSNLFLEPGVPGYKSPTPPRLGASQFRLGSSKGEEMPITPEDTRSNVDKEDEDDETGTLDSWGAPTHYAQWRSTELVTPVQLKKGADSKESTIEIRPTQTAKNESPKHADKTGFIDYTASSSR
jgi:hypothetical protein